MSNASLIGGDTRFGGQCLGKLQALAVPPTVPIRPEYPSFTWEDFQSLKGLIGLFSVMTCDASNNHSPAPNALIGRIAECLEEFRLRKDDHGQVLVGSNFYGRVT